jgi:hypothetical protein
MAVKLGKDVTVTGVTNARSITINNSANEVDCTAFSDGATGFRKYKKALIEQTVEIECVDDPGVLIGNTFTLGGTNIETGKVAYIVTNIGRSDPIDGIRTFTVSASRAKQN